MSDEILGPGDINSATLKAIFDDAYLETSVDADGDVQVRDHYSCWLRPDPDGRLILVYAVFGAREEVGQAAKLDFVNHVNGNIKLIRAWVMGDGRFWFDYYIPVDGGITRKGVVMAVRRFLSCVEVALEEDSGQVVA